jgi:putative ABC transport system substrate-binding protein
VRRREFISLLGTAMVGSPFTAQAQQAKLPVVGFLRNGVLAKTTELLDAFRQGLSQDGFIEGRTIAIEYRWGEGHYERLPALAGELARLKPSAIFAGGTGEALAVKAATAAVPIVFTGASDPVAVGLVASLNRPGGNLTGSTMIAHSLGSKRLELLRQLAPGVSVIGMLVNPNNPSAPTEISVTEGAARTLGLRIVVVKASTEVEVGQAFVAASQQKAGALVVAGDPFFTDQRERLASFGLQYKLATMYSLREYAQGGGLASYGASFANSYRQCGAYVARILRGERPADLPVLQPTQFELVLNLKIAKALGIEVPAALLAIADEVIE